jgi:hypothetical protein
MSAAVEQAGGPAISEDAVRPARTLSALVGLEAGAEQHNCRVCHEVSQFVFQSSVQFQVPLSHHAPLQPVPNAAPRRPPPDLGGRQPGGCSANMRIVRSPMRIWPA